jgi:hypothetical protein
MASMNIEWDDQGNIELGSAPGKRYSLLAFDRGTAIIPQLSRGWSDASARQCCPRDCHARRLPSLVVAKTILLTQGRRGRISDSVMVLAAGSQPPDHKDVD